MKFCLFGGTFDPVHMGHLILAEWTRVFLNLDKIIFIPSFIPPHKLNVVTPAQVRYEMVQLAIQDNPYFSIWHGLYLHLIEMGDTTSFGG